MGILQALLDQEARDHSSILELPELTEILGVSISVLNNQIEILSDLGAIDSMRTIDGGASPRILGRGRLLHEELSRKLVSNLDDEVVSSDQFVHSDDYRSVTWRGINYGFNRSQAICIRLLHQSLRNDIEWTSASQLLCELEEREFYSRSVSSAFQGHEAWNVLVVYNSSVRGMYQLKLSS